MKLVQPKFLLKIIILLIVSLHTFIGAEEKNQEINHLLEWAKNHRYFRKLRFKPNEKEFVRLAEEGQHPKALFIGCADSRVLPEILLGTNPGDLFVVRSAGNFVPTFDPQIAWDGVAASIVYAVEVLNIRDIIVCGHSHCGAIQGLYQTEKLAGFAYLNNWIKFGEKAKQLAQERIPVERTQEEIYDLTGRLSVLFQLENLLTYPAIKKKVDEGKVFLHGWYFIIEKGEIMYYDVEKGKYISLKKLQK